MSTMQRIEAPRVHLAQGGSRLIRDLVLNGVHVPDQIRARHAMEASRLWFSSSVTPQRLARARIRRAFLVQWREFGFDEYVDKYYEQYGGRVPSSVFDKAKHIRSALPGAECIIYGVPRDPAFAVRRDGEEVVLDVWYRTRDDKLNFLI